MLSIKDLSSIYHKSTLDLDNLAQEYSNELNQLGAIFCYLKDNKLNIRGYINESFPLAINSNSTLDFENINPNNISIINSDINSETISNSSNIAVCSTLNTNNELVCNTTFFITYKDNKVKVYDLNEIQNEIRKNNRQKEIQKSLKKSSKQITQSKQDFDSEIFLFSINIISEFNPEDNIIYNKILPSKVKAEYTPIINWKSPEFKYSHIACLIPFASYLRGILNTREEFGI